jgi:hypothetical protein
MTYITKWKVLVYGQNNNNKQNNASHDEEICSILEVGSDWHMGTQYEKQ